MTILPKNLQDFPVYCVGIKGTGMTALVEILVSRGARVSGSDVPEEFYTDRILTELNVPIFQGFSPRNVPSEAGLVIHSAAYDPNSHPELLEAKRLSIPLLQYNEALGQFSALQNSSGIAGVHGKTTTTAIAGVLVQGLGLPGTVLTGSAALNFGGRSVYSGGNDFFIAETCEYRRHFMTFHPSRIVLTSVEADHLDYFAHEEDVLSAFVDYGLKLPEAGTCIYCADDPGTCEVVSRLSSLRDDIAFLPYGFTAKGPYGITRHIRGQGYQEFSLGILESLGYKTGMKLRVPGNHTVLNACAALALVLSIYSDLYGDFSKDLLNSLGASLEGFRGTRRRSEVIGEAGGVLVLDDYAHHPTAIRTTLGGFRDFYPGRRIVVSFMSHTYSRTAHLLDEFSESFDSADLVILHDIYASAREKPIPGVSGQSLYEKTCLHHEHVLFEPSHDGSAARVVGLLHPGDIFLTMGAGDNWQLGIQVLKLLESRTTDQGGAS